MRSALANPVIDNCPFRNVAGMFWELATHDPVGIWHPDFLLAAG